MFKHQIYTDSHIAREPEFCPPILLSLVDYTDLINLWTNQRFPRAMIMLNCTRFMRRMKLCRVHIIY